jgi:hypothetical protein
MRETRPSGLAGGEAGNITGLPYPDPSDPAASRLLAGSPGSARPSCRQGLDPLLGAAQMR